MPRARRAWVPALGAACILAACAGVGARAPDVDSTLCACAEHRGYDRATVELGRRHYVGECARCHSAVAPADYTEDTWNGILARMARKSALSSADMVAVKAYVVSAIDASRAPAAPAR